MHGRGSRRSMEATATRRTARSRDPRSNEGVDSTHGARIDVQAQQPLIGSSIRGGRARRAPSHDPTRLRPRRRASCARPDERDYVSGRRRGTPSIACHASASAEATGASESSRTRSSVMSSSLFLASLLTTDDVGAAGRSVEGAGASPTRSTIAAASISSSSSEAAMDRASASVSDAQRVAAACRRSASFRAERAARRSSTSSTRSCRRARWRRPSTRPAARSNVALVRTSPRGAPGCAEPGKRREPPGGVTLAR